MTVSQTASRVHRFKFSSFDGEDMQADMQKNPAEKIADTPAIELPPPPPLFTEQELQNARNEGHAKGMQEGGLAAQAKLDKEAAAREESIHSLLEVIANRITIAAESHTAYLKQQQETVSKLVLAVAQKIAGDALKREPYANVESLMLECMGMINGEAKVMVVVSPARSEGLRQRIDTLKPMLQGFEGEIAVGEDEALSDHDCRVEWKNGYGERNTDILWKKIEAIIATTTL